jgi:hypothetical protein
LWLIASKIAEVRAIDERSITVRTSERREESRSESRREE